MSFLQILFFAVILIASVYFTLLNQAVIPIHLTTTLEFDSPVSILLLIIFLLGLVIAYTLNLFGNFKLRITLWSKYRKKEKLNESYVKGLEYYISGQQKKSIPLLKKALEKNSSKVIPLTLIGNYYRSRDDYRNAVDYHQKAKTIAPGNKFVLKSLEEDYNATENLKLQRETVKELTVIEKDNVDNLKRLTNLHTKSENWNEAIVVQNKIIKKISDPKRLKKEKRNASIYYYESALGAFNNDFFQAAIQKLKSSIKVDADFTAPHILLGETYLKLNKPKKALKAWEKGYQQTEDPLFLKRIDKYYIGKNRPKEVVQLYQNAINKKPKTPLLHFLLGEAYIRFEMYDDAMEEFQKAYAYNPDSIALSLLIGKTYERKDDFKSASDEYQKAFEKELASVLQFTCGSCGYRASKWLGRCPQCKEWDIVSFDINRPAQKLLD